MLWKRFVSCPSLAAACLAVAVAGSGSAWADTAAAQKDNQLATILEAQPAEVKNRYAARHPAETIAFFELKAGDTVIEALPGGGWYSGILYPHLGENGVLIGANYPRRIFERIGFDADRVQRMMDRHTNWPGKIKAAAVAKGGALELYTMTEMPARLDGKADKVLFIRALHNIYRFDKDTGDVKTVLAEAFRSLKPGGLVGVVQHRAPESASDDWANGSRGYLKQSKVIADFEAAGFKLVESREINANPKDRPSGKDRVWRLPPSLRGPEKNSPEWRKNKEIGESDRMTLKFVKPAA